MEEVFHASRQIPTLRWVADALLDAYLKAGHTIEATGLLQEQLAEARKTLPEDSPQLAGALAQFGLMLLMAKAPIDAEPVLRECLMLRETLQSAADGAVLSWQVANVMSMLGEALASQQKYVEAESLLLAGYEGLKENESAIPPQGKSRPTEALQRLVDFYLATGQAEKADAWRVILEEAKPAVPMPE
ncbi:MAG TPA: hypothetical protein VGX78_18415 [Pirellulales bacterium]|nr:hypothetical protein [Pirellulales bacterium]